MAAGAPAVNVQHSGEASDGALRLRLACSAALAPCSAAPGASGRCAWLPRFHASTVVPVAEKGATALMAAAVHGRADVVSALLSNGADPALTLPGAGHSARDLAQLYGHAAVLEVLDEYREQVGAVGRRHGLFWWL
jgi:hypothetical protein